MMAEWGFASWDASGVPNNYGVKPISLVGKIDLNDGQQSGSYSFTVPAGFKLGYMVGLSPSFGNYQAGRRTISVSGNTIVIGSAGDNSIGTNVYVADKAQVVVFLEKA